MEVFTFIAILVVLIVVHELGHFLTAKLFGIKVDEFGIGYPPRAAIFGKIGDTLYTLNWLPFGGFVRIYGEDDTIEYNEETAKVAFSQKPRIVQACVLSAGVVFNVIFAWMLFTAVLLLGAPSTVDEAKVIDGSASARLVLTAVLPQSPAQEVGLTSGDEIVNITSKGHSVGHLVPSEVSAFIQDNVSRDIVISYKREGDDTIFKTIPFSAAHGVLKSSPGTPAIGISMALIGDSRLSFGEAAVRAGKQTVHTAYAVVVGLKGFFTTVVLGTADWSQIAGPVGLVSLVGDATSVGFVYLLYFIAFISVNLAVINLIPLPALDGGRLAILGIEAVIRRPLRNRVMSWINVIGFGGLILLMIIVTYHDIINLLMR